MSEHEQILRGTFMRQRKSFMIDQNKPEPAQAFFVLRQRARFDVRGWRRCLTFGEPVEDEKHTFRAEVAMDRFQRRHPMCVVHHVQQGVDNGNHIERLAKVQLFKGLH